MKIDGTLKDLVRAHRAATPRSRSSRATHPEALELLRHDAAHVLAEAVQELFPGTQVTIGPAIEDGFYYDFARDEPFSRTTSPPIEKRMARDRRPRREDRARGLGPRRGDRRYFESIGESYKAEIIRELPGGRGRSPSIARATGRTCAAGRTCPRRKLGKAFKLTKLAGAYWRGDPKQRPAAAHLRHGLGRTRSDLDAYLHAHRGGREARPPQASAGPWTSSTCRKRPGHGLLAPQGLDAVPHAGGLYAPPPGGRRLCRGQDAPDARPHPLGEARATGRSSGDNMFVCETDEGEVAGAQADELPGPRADLQSGPKRYRDLPLRMAEFGACHRYEPSGALHGLMRVRAFTQDDAHIFCREDQIEEETRRASSSCCSSVYADLGFTDARVQPGRPRPELRAGTDEVWDKAEGDAARGRRRRRACPMHLAPGEGAFYGPKLDFHLRDAIGRDLAVRHAAARLRPARAAGRRATSARTARSTGRSCCTGRSSARWSASSAS